MISSTGTDRLCAAIVAASLFCSGQALAQSSTRQGTAQTLFDEAIKLFEAHDYDAACEKFRASEELDPKGGTLLNLALCREKQGRIASAWTAFSEARNRSLKEGRAERVSFAEKKLAELKPLLPTLRVVVADAVPALVLRVDGDDLPRPAWTANLPVDPGSHVVTASAPGHRTVTVTFQASPREESVVTIPPLAPEAPPAAVAPAPAPERAPGRGPPSWVGWTSIGAGAAFIGTGAVFGVQAFAQRSEAESLCSAGRCDEGRRANDEGVRDGWIANAGIALGVVAIGAGLYMLLVRGQ